MYKRQLPEFLRHLPGQTHRQGGGEVRQLGTAQQLSLIHISSRRSERIRTMSADSMAMSLPLPMAQPTSRPHPGGGGLRHRQRQ